MKRFAFPLLAIVGLVCAPVVANAHHQAGHPHAIGMQIAQAHQHAPSASAATASPADKAMQDANAKMHHDMDIKPSGDIDTDFIRGMIPHHQGAIDMAKVVMTYGKDPEVRKLAEAIVKAQEGEIAWMQEWLKKNGK